jgi:hypothetical protein
VLGTGQADAGSSESTDIAGENPHKSPTIRGPVRAEHRTRKDRQIHFVKTAKSSAKPDRFSKTAMVVRRVISKQGIVSYTEIDIRSPHLQQVFQTLFKGVDGFELNKTPPVVCKKKIVHYHDFYYNIAQIGLFRLTSLF